MELSNSDKELLINSLFYFYIKREPKENEFTHHLNRFISQNRSIKDIDREFNTCSEAADRAKAPFNPFLLQKTNPQSYPRLIQFIYYFATKSELNDQSLLEQFVKELTANSDIDAIVKKMSVPGNNYQLVGEIMVKVARPKSTISVELPIYQITYDLHAGHTFAYVIRFISHMKNRDYMIGTTKSYNDKFRHVLEMYDILRPNRRIVFDPDAIYDMQLEPLPHPFNIKSLVTTASYEGVRDVTYDPVGKYPGPPNSNFVVELFADNKSTRYQDSNMEYMRTIIDHCRLVHQSEETVDRVFLVKNMKSTPFNFTPSRGFQFDSTESYIEECGFKILDPELMPFSKLVYLLSHAKYIITSWNTIMYINKLFFNKDAQVIVLCHNGYLGEYRDYNHRKTIYYANCAIQYFIFNLRSDSVTPEGMDYMMELFKIK